jgi:multidrug efflux system membrane fusion protein
VVTQQNETDAVISSGLSASDRVVTTGFANLSDGAKVIIGKEDSAPSADLAPRKRTRAPDASGKDSERRGKKGEGDQKGQTGPAPAEGGAKSGSEAKSPP